MGAIDLIGCVTKVTEYNSATTMKQRISVTDMTTKPQMRTSISSGVRFGFWLDVINFLLQDWGYKILGALLSKQALWLLTFFGVEEIWILTFVAVTIFATHQ